MLHAPVARIASLMEGMLVSVVMPAHDAERYIGRPIASVLAQTWRQLELIIVDDASRDGTLALIEEQARTDPRIRIVRLSPNGGVAMARNAGIAAARGNYVGFLDSDDWWHPRKLELQLAWMQRSGARVSYAAYDRMAEADGALLSRVRPPASVSYTDMLKSNRIGNLTGMYERDLGDVAFRRIGHEDYVFWLEMVRRAGGASCVPSDEPLAWYLVRKGSVSSDKLKAARWQWRIYREVEQLGLFASAFYLLHYIGNAIGKRR
jgi:glycosyltransferase involved in cell wall biosynthesis